MEHIKEALKGWKSTLEYHKNSPNNLCTIYFKFYEALWQVCVQNKPKVIIHRKTWCLPLHICEMSSCDWSANHCFESFNLFFWWSFLMNPSIWFTLVWLIHSRARKFKWPSCSASMWQMTQKQKQQKNNVVLWWPNVVIWVNCSFKASNFFNTPSYCLLQCADCLQMSYKLAVYSSSKLSLVLF